MTYVRYLAIGGFKSLRDWNLLEFAPRVTVLVGGNGTGKSSLSEALIWGLGEDSAEELRVTRPQDLVFRASSQRSVAEQELLYHRPAGEVDERAAEREAVVYLVLGEEEDSLSHAAEEGQACCCKPRTDNSTDVPPGGLRVGRVVGLEGDPSWELDGEPASGAQITAALRRYGLDRGSVAVIRQGELERLLVAGEALRADIIAETLGISLPVTAPLAPAPPKSIASDEEPTRHQQLTEELLLAGLQRWGEGGAGHAELASAGLGISRPAHFERSVEELLDLLEHEDAKRGFKSPQERGETVAPAFAEALVRIDQHFERIFARLTGGGEATIRLTWDEDRLGVGVEATFPDHPPVHLDALSGGQRALVAFALGLAVFEEGRARLLVFDEVEPALDESNVRVFNELLHEAAEDHQVVIISHQRRTKDVGDVVFGFDHLGDGAAGLHFRYEPSTRRLVVFGRVRGNWLERASQLAEEPAVGWSTTSQSQVEV